MSSRKRRGLWVAVSTGIPLSRLALEGSAEAFKLWVIGLAVARQEQGLGDLSPAAAGRLAGVGPEAAEELLEIGAWHRRGHSCDRCPNPPGGRVQIHAYLDWQDSPEEIAQRTEAGRVAARKRWASDPDSEPHANRIQNKNKNKKSSPSDSSAPPPAAAKRATATPPGWLTGSEPLPEGCSRWLQEQGVTNLAWVRSESEQLADWAVANGRKYKDWEAAWRNWLRRSLDRAGGRPAPAGELRDEEEEAAVREWLRLHPLETPPELLDLERSDLRAWDEAMRPLRAAHAERARSEVRRSKLRAVQ